MVPIIIIVFFEVGKLWAKQLWAAACASCALSFCNYELHGFGAEDVAKDQPLFAMQTDIFSV